MATATRHVPMPHLAGFSFHNGCREACDMADGPCACGAWHSLSCWHSFARQGRLPWWAFEVIERAVWDANR